MTGWHIPVHFAAWYFYHTVLFHTEIHFSSCWGDCSHQSWVSTEFSLSYIARCICVFGVPRCALQHRKQELRQNMQNILGSVSAALTLRLPGLACMCVYVCLCGAMRSYTLIALENRSEGMRDRGQQTGRLSLLTDRLSGEAPREKWFVSGVN